MTIFWGPVNFIFALPGILWIWFFLDKYLTARLQYPLNYLLLVSGALFFALTTTLAYIAVEVYKAGEVIESEKPHLWWVFLLAFIPMLFFMSRLGAKRKRRVLEEALIQDAWGHGETAAPDMQIFKKEARVQSVLIKIGIAAAFIYPLSLLAHFIYHTSPGGCQAAFIFNKDKTMTMTYPLNFIKKDKRDIIINDPDIYNFFKNYPQNNENRFVAEIGLKETYVFGHLTKVSLSNIWSKPVSKEISWVPEDAPGNAAENVPENKLMYAIAIRYGSPKKYTQRPRTIYYYHTDKPAIEVNELNNDTTHYIYNDDLLMQKITGNSHGDSAKTTYAYNDKKQLENENISSLYHSEGKRKWRQVSNTTYFYINAPALSEKNTEYMYWDEDKNEPVKLTGRLLCRECIYFNDSFRKMVVDSFKYEGKYYVDCCRSVYLKAPRREVKVTIKYSTDYAHRITGERVFASAKDAVILKIKYLVQQMDYGKESGGFRIKSYCQNHDNFFADETTVFFVQY